MSEPMHKQFHLGQLVEGKIEKVFPYGVFVRLDHNIRAYIRRRELSLTGDCEPRQIVQIGQMIKGVISALPCSGRILELSHKATLPNPWDAFLRAFQEGDVVQGKIKDVQAYGLFVELTPGIDGFVPLAEIATWPIERPDELFWVGDQVEAIITKLDVQERKVRLSIQRRLEHLGRVADIVEMLEQRSTCATAKESVTPLMALTAIVSPEAQTSPILSIPVCPAPIGRILIVEDSPEIGEPLLDWFVQLGFTVDLAQTPAAATTQLEQFSYGLLLVDIDLPLSNGLHLIRHMKAKLAGAVLAVMSAPERLAEYGQEIEELGVVETFVKPLDLAEIDQCLVRMGQGDLLPARRSAPGPSRSPAFQSFRTFTTAFQGKRSDVERLRICLEQLVKSVGAEVGIIFYQDPVSYTISIRTHAGTLTYRETALYALKESPVKDVIQGCDFIFENQVLSWAESRFRKLLHLLPFESCIGIPVEAEGEIQHALFLFHRRPLAFKHYHMRDAMATAILCAAVLERTLFNQQIWSLNQWVLGGQLAASFGHEVFNKLSGLDIQLHNLHTELIRQSPALPNQLGVQTMQQDVVRLMETAKNLRLMVKNFQQLMKAGDEQALFVDKVVNNVIAQLRPLASKNGVKLKAECEPELPRVLGNPVRLQQILFNLLLNAIQHSATRPQNMRLVLVVVVYTAAERECPLKLRISDQGPGIHKQLWEKVFELSFTTRPDGSGLGLFIAKSLVMGMGGKISVERSVIPLGTTFLVELPALRLTEEGGP